MRAMHDFVEILNYFKACEPNLHKIFRMFPYLDCLLETPGLDSIARFCVSAHCFSARLIPIAIDDALHDTFILMRAIMMRHDLPFHVIGIKMKTAHIRMDGIDRPFAVRIVR